MHETVRHISAVYVGDFSESDCSRKSAGVNLFPVYCHVAVTDSWRRRSVEIQRGEFVYGVEFCKYGLEGVRGRGL